MKNTNARKVIVAVAPVGKELRDSEVKNPLSPDEVARQVVDCAAAGASMVHLHVRDAEGQPTADLTEFTKTLDLIRQRSDIIIQGSTGGAAKLSLQDRCVSLREPRVEVASLNMGSVNFGDSVYVNTLPDIRYWMGEMKAHHVRPELEVFDLSMMSTSEALLGEGTLTGALHFNFCLGFPSALPADPDMLYMLRSKLPSGSSWGLIHDGMTDFRLHAAALGLGAGSLRVGFEDGTSYGLRRKARENVDLVEHLVELIRGVGVEVATPSEARAMLGLQTPPKE